MVKRIGNGSNGNSSCHSGQVSEGAIEAIPCTVFLLSRASAGCLVLRHHLLTTALFWRAHFEMGNGRRGIEEIHEEAKQ
jgi:hypothetical protein